MSVAALLALSSGDSGESTSVRAARPQDVLMSRLRTGDERALETLFRNLADHLAAFAKRVGIDAGDAEQVVIDVFHDVWKRRAELPENAGTPYLFRAVRNRALDVARGERRRARHEAEAGILMFSAPSFNEGVDAEDERSDVIARVRAAISSLPESQRTVLYLRYTREMSINEVAQAMDISAGAVKMLLQRATRTLGKQVGGVFEGFLGA